MQVINSIVLALALGLAAAAVPEGGAAPEAAAAPAALLAEAEAAYAAGLAAAPAQAQGHFQRAARRYESLLAREGANGHLYYNLGNCHRRLGDTGRAILCYLRAEELLPRDPDVRRNLALARDQAADRVEGATGADAARVLFFWHYDLSPDARRAAALAAAALFWLLIALRLRDDWRRRVSRGWLAGLALVALACGGSLGYAAWERQARPAGVVIAPAVTARQGDGDGYGRAFKEDLHSGTEFTLRENRGAWWRVRLADGRDCWVPAAAAALVRG